MWNDHKIGIHPEFGVLELDCEQLIVRAKRIPCFSTQPSQAHRATRNSNCCPSPAHSHSTDTHEGTSWRRSVGQSARRREILWASSATRRSVSAAHSAL
ncbi:hypothetical protein M2164_000319 [Streptomyces sp. SAI-208]|nr:hypothetical protein [Streptomyces sp. SAI-208]